MKRPLVITDCDEVLLFMVNHFRDWLGEEHGVDMTLAQGFENALSYRETGEPVEREEIWKLLGGFFDTEMHRQDLIPGADEAIGALSEKADVVVLTNLQDHRREDRTQQLKKLGIDLQVYTNQGPKGPALQKILDEHGADRRSFFIDDLAVHHGSVAGVAPQVTRLHFVGEPDVAPHATCAYTAGDAHARIDAWDEALPWLLKQIEGDDA